MPALDEKQAPGVFRVPRKKGMKGEEDQKIARGGGRDQEQRGEEGGGGRRTRDVAF